MLKAILWIAALFFLPRESAEAYLYPTKTPVLSHVRPIGETAGDTGLNCVDCIYVINLDTRTDKWQHTLREMQERGLKPLRFSGING